MKYRKFSVPILAILLAISFASCSNFSLDSLFTNYYKQAGLGQVTAAAIADAPVADLIDQSGIVAGQLSETFFEMLTANADAGGTLTQDTLDKLEVIMNDPVAQPAIAQAAIALAIEINLNEVGADQVIANAPAAFALFADPTFVITEPANLKKLLDLLLPASLLNRSIFTPAELETITAIVDKLNSLDLQNYFEKLVANLDLNGLQAQGMDAGTIAQIGLIVKVMNSITPLYPVGAPSLGASVAELLNHLEDNNLDPGLYIDYSNLMNNYQTILEDPALTTLLDAAGIDLQSIIDQFMNN